MQRGISGCRMRLCGAPITSRSGYFARRRNTSFAYVMWPLRLVLLTISSSSANGHSMPVGVIARGAMRHLLASWADRPYADECGDLAPRRLSGC